MKCKSCGANITNDHCEYCGQDAELYCKSCGEPLDKDWTMCPECGLLLKETNGSTSQYNRYKERVIVKKQYYNDSSMKNKWIAIALCAFFGYLGAHKFYEGKTGMGILYIFTCGLFFIGVIIDIINLISNPEYYNV